MPAPVARALSDVYRARLNTCHMDLIRVVAQVALATPIAVVCGHRGQIEQTAAFDGGQSKTPWPRSYHNAEPSLAVDLAPLVESRAQPGKLVIDWSDAGAFERLADTVKATAGLLGVPIEWGGDWRRFLDRPHYQLGATHPDVVAWRASLGQLEG